MLLRYCSTCDPPECTQVNWHSVLCRTFFSCNTSKVSASAPDRIAFWDRSLMRLSYSFILLLGSNQHKLVLPILCGLPFSVRDGVSGGTPLPCKWQWFQELIVKEKQINIIWLCITVFPHSAWMYMYMHLHACVQEVNKGQVSKRSTPGFSLCSNPWFSFS